MIRRAVLAVAIAAVSACSGSPGPVGPVGPGGPTGTTGTTGASGYFDTGCPGALIEGVCLLEWSNAQATNFLDASKKCAEVGGDLCTDSQAWSVAVGGWTGQYNAPTVLYGAHWLSGYSDNDAYTWPAINGMSGTDNSASSNLYGYACCGGTTPINPRAPGKMIGDVWVTYVHNIKDTLFSGAVAVCNSLRSDICTDSQAFLLRKEGALTVPNWTAFHADNDGGLYTAINGGTNDDTASDQVYGFACCGSTRPLDLGCPVARIGGVCAVSVHNAQDSTFDTAATACAARRADICSMSQTAVLRANGALSVLVWTSSHSDNDAGVASNVVLGAGFPDQSLLTSQYGYACCLN